MMFEVYLWAWAGLWFEGSETFQAVLLVKSIWLEPTGNFPSEFSSSLEKADAEEWKWFTRKGFL